MQLGQAAAGAPRAAAAAEAHEPTLRERATGNDTRLAQLARCATTWQTEMQIWHADRVLVLQEEKASIVACEQDEKSKMEGEERVYYAQRRRTANHRACTRLQFLARYGPYRHLLLWAEAKVCRKVRNEKWKSPRVVGR